MIAVQVQVDSIETAKVALKAGARCLVLCSSLIEGGMTPRPSLLTIVHKIKKIGNITLLCLLRCRPGNYTYNEDEIKVMKKDAGVLKMHGADGFVFGALTTENNVDITACHQILGACLPLPMIFSTAFDYVKHPRIDLEVLIALGYKKILTSGQQPTAEQGLELLNELVTAAKDAITIVAARGINLRNIRQILHKVPVQEVHVTCKMYEEERVRTGSTRFRPLRRIPENSEEETGQSPKINTIDITNSRELTSMIYEIVLARPTFL